MEQCGKILALTLKWGGVPKKADTGSSPVLNTKCEVDWCRFFDMLEN